MALLKNGNIAITYTGAKTAKDVFAKVFGSSFGIVK